MNNNTDPVTEARRKAVTKASVLRVFELKLAIAERRGNAHDIAILRENIAKAKAQ